MIRHCFAEILTNHRIHFNQLRKIMLNQELEMAAIDTLNANVAQLKTDVEALIAQVAGTSEAQVQAAADAVAALDAEVQAKLTPAG